MARKRTLLAHEVETIAIMIPLEVLDFPRYKSMEEAYLDSKDEKPKMIEVHKVLNLAYSYGALANNIYDEKYLVVFMPVGDRKKIDELFSKYEEDGKKPQFGDKSIILDKRYLEGGRFYGISVPVPPPYIDEYIRDTFERYGELRLMEDQPDKALVYCIELDDETPVLLLVRKDFISGGIKNGEMFSSFNPTRDYKTVVDNIESDILDYLHDGDDGNRAQA